MEPGKTAFDHAADVEQLDVNVEIIMPLSNVAAVDRKMLCARAGEFPSTLATELRRGLAS